MARRKTEFQEELIPQKRIAEVETWIVKCDAKKAEIDTYNDTAKEELKSHEAKLREALHKHVNGLDAQEDGEGNKTFVYKRGEYEATLKGHERLSYGKVRNKAEKDEGEPRTREEGE